MAGKNKTESAWNAILEDYNIVENIESYGSYEIKASEIKKYREPRLMVKWDSIDNLPKALKRNSLNVIPNSRGSYIISDFNLYEQFPVLTKATTKIEHIDIPKLETIDVDEITTESAAIYVLLISGVIQKFLDTGDFFITFSGRMGTGEFDFNIDRKKNEPIGIHVDRAQCEIDAGLENDECVVIIEAKNVLHPDFNVRQLYFPYRCWDKKVDKPIRLLYSVYTNKVFRLYEYVFEDKYNYSSIKCVKSGLFSLENTVITLNELVRIVESTKVIYKDRQGTGLIPFPQADVFERIISLLDILSNEPLDTIEIADVMEFHERQSDYYYNAGKYLGIFEKKTMDDRIKVCVTSLGMTLVRLPYREKQIEFVRLLAQHKLFNRLLLNTFKNKKVPCRKVVVQEILDLRIFGDNPSMSTVIRRAATVRKWLEWCYVLSIDEDEI